MRVLGIETTCDETAASVVINGTEIISNVVRSQILKHMPFGGVVPELASRQHVDTILPVVKKALSDAGCTLDDIDRIAVAKGPGLIGALLVGITFAKGLSLGKNIPLVGVNHIEAHLYAAMMTKKPLLFPAIGMVLSGGHTSLVEITDIGQYRLIGETVDDAAGEAFDKAAKILGLAYPGGPEIEKLAKSGDPNTFSFKAGQVKKSPLDFSFSGIKTAVLYAYKKVMPDDLQAKQDIACSFQKAVADDICKKLKKAVALKNPKALYFGGGVTKNQFIRNEIEKQFSLPIYFPDDALCLDNACMIAGLGFYSEKDDTFVEPETRIPFLR